MGLESAVGVAGTGGEQGETACADSAEMLARQRGLEKDVSGGGEVGRPRRVVCAGGQDCSERGQDTGGSYGSWIFRQMREGGTRCDDVGVAVGGRHWPLMEPGCS